MHKQLSEVLEKLDRDTQHVIAILQQVPADVLHHSDGNNWSALQIATHIATAERTSLQYMQKKYLGVNQLANTGLTEAVKLLLLKLSQRLPIRYKAPVHVVERTPAMESLQALTAYWMETRDTLRNFLSDIPEVQIRKKIYKHPIAGYLNVVQGVAFLREHLLHHLPQIEKRVNNKK